MRSFEKKLVSLPFFFFWLYSPVRALAAFMKLSVSLQLLGQSVGLLGWVFSSSEGLYLYTNTENAHETSTLDIHAQSGIRSHGPDVRAIEDSL
jgi:hypothetical protein